MKRRIFCFGDSNTYGFDPSSFIGGRYGELDRWTGILSRDPGFEILNYGMNGREIPSHPFEYRSFGRQLSEEADKGGIDLVTILLGTNDLLFHYGMTAEMLAGAMEEFLRYVLAQPAVSGDSGKVLLLSPCSFDLPYRDARLMNEESKKVGAALRPLASRLGVRFSDVDSWGLSFAEDLVHFSPEGHRIFARELGRILHEIFPDEGFPFE